MMVKNKTFLASTDSRFVKVAKHYLHVNRGNILRTICSSSLSSRGANN